MLSLLLLPSKTARLWTPSQFKTLLSRRLTLPALFLVEVAAAHNNQKPVVPLVEAEAVGDYSRSPHRHLSFGRQFSKFVTKDKLLVPVPVLDATGNMLQLDPPTLTEDFVAAVENVGSIKELSRELMRVLEENLLETGLQASS